MSATSRNTQCFAAVLLVLAVTAAYGRASAAQQPSDAATAKLKALSESPNAADVAEIRRLIKDGADVNVRNKFGVTPLIMASLLGHTDVVKLLLAAGADVNAKANKGGEDYTALRIAKMRGHTQIIKLLTEHGAKE